MAKGPSGQAERRIASELDPGTIESAERKLKELVAKSGGPKGREPIQVDGLETLAPLFQAWAEHVGGAAKLAPGAEFRFESHPGLWHALQALVPLEDPDRWNAVRAAVIKRLQSSRGWVRESEPRGSIFLIPKGGQRDVAGLSDAEEEAMRQRIEERRRRR